MTKIVFKNAKVFCTQERAFDDLSIVCEEGKIVELRQSNDVKEDEKVIDFTGKWIVPGYINVHEHQTYKRLVGPLFGPSGSFFGITETELTLRAVRSSLYSLRKGITTILEAGAPGTIPYGMRKAIERNDIPGPRMYISGQAFSITGGHGHELCIEVDSPDEMRKGVRESLKKGVDLIKILASEEPVYTTYDEPVIPQVETEMLIAAAEEIHRVFKPLSVHAMGVEQIQRCIDGNVDIVNHGAYMTRNQARAMKEKGMTIVPTLSSYRLTANDRFKRGSLWSEKHKTLWDAFDKMAEYVIEEKVNIAIGTDSIGDYFHELEMLSRRGLSNSDCILAATINGAKALMQDRNIGSIESGKFADFVVLNSDPSKDIMSLKNIYRVIKDGRIYEPELLQFPGINEDVFVNEFEVSDEWK